MANVQHFGLGGILVEELKNTIPFLFRLEHIN